MASSYKAAWSSGEDLRLRPAPTNPFGRQIETESQEVGWLSSATHRSKGMLSG